MICLKFVRSRRHSFPLQRFLVSPCPRAAGVVQCYIRRNKIRANKLFPEYSLFMKVKGGLCLPSYHHPVISLFRA